MEEAQGPSAVAARWAAAGEAMAWEAAIHEHAAWRARRKAWVAMAGAGGGDAADAQGSMDVDEAGRALEAMSRAAASMRRAAKRFMRSSEMKEAAGYAKMRSSAAHERAGEAERAQLMREWAEGAHKSALGGAKMSATVADDAKEIVKDAEWVTAGAAERPAGRPDLGGRPGALAAAQADTWEDAKRRRTGPARMAVIARKGKRSAARVMTMSATVAERAAAAAATAASRERAGPDIEEAEAAWKEAMSSAGRANAGGDRGEGGRRIKVALEGQARKGPRPGGKGRVRAAVRCQARRRVRSNSAKTARKGGGAREKQSRRRPHCGRRRAMQWRGRHRCAIIRRGWSAAGGGQRGPRPMMRLGGRRRGSGGRSMRRAG